MLIGGFIAYAGVIVLLMGLGWLLGFAFTKAGLEPLLAQFIGLGIVGLLIAGAGTAFLLTAMKAISKESLVPERTVHTLRELSGKPGEPMKKSEVEALTPKVSSAELEKRVERTEQHIEQTIEELGRRVKPSYIKLRIKNRLKRNPYRNGFIAMGMGVLSGLIVKARMRRA
jgi:hypothetical protein